MVLAFMLAACSITPSNLEGDYKISIHNPEIDSLKSSDGFGAKLFKSLSQLMDIRATLTQDSIFWDGNLGAFNFDFQLNEAPASAYEVKNDSLFIWNGEEYKGAPLKLTADGFEMTADEGTTIKFTRQRE